MKTTKHEQDSVVSQWRQEYVVQGIPSSYRVEPSATVSGFFWNYLQDKNISPPAKVADLGCGRGRNSFFFATKGFDVTAIDFVEENIVGIAKYAEQNNLKITAICGDISEKLPFDDSSLDIIIDVFCYKHQTSDTKRQFYREELFRVLKDEGHYLLVLAGKDDGYYGSLPKDETGAKIVDPATGVGSVLFDPEDIVREFSNYKCEKIETVQREGLMHEATYQRVTHAFILQKDRAEDTSPQPNSIRS